MKLRILFLSVLVLIFAFSAIGITFAGVTETIVGGNPTNLVDPNLRWEDPITKTYSYESVEITITVRSTEEGQVFDFLSNTPILRAVAKGGNQGATVYNYNPAVLSGIGLHAPRNINPQGKIGGYADLSWIGFLTGVIPPPVEPPPVVPPVEPPPVTPPSSDDETKTPPPSDEKVKEDSGQDGINRLSGLAYTYEVVPAELPYTGAPVELLYLAAVSGALGLALRKIKL